MNDNLIVCKKCTGCCYETRLGLIKSYICISCGFQSNSTITEGSANQKDYESTLPQLYIDLKFVDDEKKAWYPSTINIPDKGILFMNGTNKTDCKWTVMLVQKVSDSEKEKFKDTKGEYFTHKIDPSTAKHFSLKDYMDGIETLGLLK